MRQSQIRPIRNDEDHSWALARIDELMDAAPGTPEMDELEVLAQLVEIYETEKWPMALPTPLAALKYRMEQAGLSRRDIEPYIGSSGKVSEVLRGKVPLTLKMIRALHRHLGIPAEVLLGTSDNRLDDDGLAQVVQNYPLKEMAEKGWLDAFGPVKGREEEALRWLSSRAGVEPGRFSAYCRKNDEARQNSKMNSYAFQAWCLQVLAQAAEINLATRYEAGFLSGDALRRVATLSPLPEGPKRAQEYLAQLGIRLVIVEHLKKTYLDGAAMLMPDGSPVVALTLRYDRVDSFWHNLLHELAHVKNDLGSGCAVLCDDFSIPSAGSELEQRADREAAEALVPPGILPQTDEALAAVDAQGLARFARQAGVHPAIVAGQIRHDTGNWKKFSKLVVKEEVKPYFA